MPFDLNNIPHTIAGTEPLPREYGKSANQRYYDLTQQAADEFHRTGNAEPLEQTSQASVRYTPEGTITKGNATEEAVENAIGYAEGDIEHLDRDGDRALSQKEVADFLLQPFVAQLTQLKNEYRAVNEDPEATLEQKQAVLMRFEKVEKAAFLATVKAAKIVATTDLPDESGRRDGKLTADELAAKNLFDDAAVDMFSDNKAAYQILTGALQAKTDYSGPSFTDLESRIAEIRRRGYRHPMAMDGQITQGEHAIADVLEDAPIPTNQIVKAIHEGLALKARVATVGASPPADKPEGKGIL